jgi:hypothetical protein
MKKLILILFFMSFTFSCSKQLVAETQEQKLAEALKYPLDYLYGFYGSIEWQNSSEEHRNKMSEYTSIKENYLVEHFKSEREDLLRISKYISPEIKAESLKYVDSERWAEIHQNVRTGEGRYKWATSILNSPPIPYIWMDFSIDREPQLYDDGYKLHSNAERNKFYQISKGTISLIEITDLKADVWMDREGYKLLEAGPYTWSPDGKSIQWNGHILRPFTELLRDMYGTDY